MGISMKCMHKEKKNFSKNCFEETTNSVCIQMIMLVVRECKVSNMKQLKS